MNSKKTAIGCLSFVFLAVLALSAQDVPVKPAAIGGVWEMTTQTPQGDMTADATIVQENDKFKFSMVGLQGMEMNGEGTVKGQDVEWTVTISAPMGEFMLVYKGKVDGETMSGEVQAGDFGAFPFTAKKKK
ncbi:MAG: hypothetical protein A2V76_00390 [Candidatus Aminicenantes bacterium RBG_16_63_14]|nr:MAG: hypothetical protein A2V76_00390 [Candidatus Aminicenantes bacterium RBG_16_63_14]OGD27366.1 MAG: hypothetical protein A2V57_08600 [Candidatus Aminicenantes bacterium RBG_19FT_COMBO_65_30]